MTEHTEYKTRPDGSIDTAHYMARGRELRSAAFLDALGKLRPALRRKPRLESKGIALPRFAIAPARG